MNGRSVNSSSACVACLLTALVVGALGSVACGGETASSTSPSAATSPSPAPSLPPQTYPGTLVVTRVSEPRHNYDIYLVRSDGTGLTRLTHGRGNEEHAYWSPDGTRIVYGAGGAIWVMRADGSGKVRVGSGGSPSWSPDGTRILYGDGDVWVMNADGSGRQRVVGPSASYATWGRNGMIVFVRVGQTGGGWGATEAGGDRYAGGDLFAVNPDGSGLVRLTKKAGMILPSVSPDGTTIAAYVPKKDRIVAVPWEGEGAQVTLLARASRSFPNRGMPIAQWTSDGRRLVLGSSNYGEDGGAGLYLVNADGSGLTRVPRIKDAICPDWRPEPASPSPMASPIPALSHAVPPPAGLRLGGSAWEAGTFGWRFTPTVDIEVMELGCYDEGQDGLARRHRVGIFDAETEHLLASVTVRPKSRLDGLFRYEALATPLVLTAGRPYLVGTEDRKTLETVYNPGEDEQGDASLQWASQIAFDWADNMYVSRPPEGAFTAPTVRLAVWTNPPGFSPNLTFKPVRASSPTP